MKLNEDITGMDNRAKPLPSSTPTGASININKKDLSDPSIQRNISKMKGSTVNVLDEEGSIAGPVKLKYLSNVKDADGKVSKPFTLNGKNYQVVRALSPNREKVNGIYCLDEVDEAGENIIHPVDHFERTYVKKPVPSVAIQETSTEKPLKPLQLANYKFFFVNQETGKARKFKSAEELAKATIKDDETFMNLSDFKKYVSGTLFGKKEKKDELTEDLSEDQSPDVLHKKALNLMSLISKKIPTHIIDSIKANKVAQREVLNSFIDFIGIPRNMLPQMFNYLKSNEVQPVSPTTQDGSNMTFEHKIISKNNLINETLGI